MSKMPTRDIASHHPIGDQLLEDPGAPGFYAGHTIVDGIIELRQRIYGVRNERGLLVHKVRGTGYLKGEHAFRITPD